MSQENPIVVDLDGTLIRTNILWESLFLLAKKNPLRFIISPLWLLRGRSFLKKRLADYIQPDVSVLPYSKNLLRFLQDSKDKRTKLILASATDERIVKAIGSYLGLFDTVIGTSDGNNIKGKQKLDLINQICGRNKFDYVGNEKADIPIWYESETAYVVSNSKRLLDSIPKKPDQIRVFRPPSGSKHILKAFRPHQWIKNILLFVPLFLAHEINSLEKISILLLSFLCMSLCASSVYIINDILDLEADRHHPFKKRRPFAAGLVSIPGGLVLSFSLLLIAFATSSLLLPPEFTAILISYFSLSTVYSLFLKDLLLLDVIGLSALYSLRIFAGGVVVSIPLSPWLLAFSSFFFLSLAFAKRYVELKEIESNNVKKIRGRSYYVDDLQILLGSGIASGYVSVLVFFLYITNSKEVFLLYSNPMWLWFIGPLLIYWLTRLWILSQRKTMDSDPVLFALKDFSSWITALVIISLLLLGALF